MARIRLRTKLVLSLILTTAALTGASLLIVQNYLERRARQEIHEQIASSFVTFEHFTQQRQKLLVQSAAVSADLPNIKALMTTDHEITIQDASADFWQLTESDLFLLADPDGKVMALHTSADDFHRENARTSLGHTLQMGRSRDWWFGSGRLYEVFLQPIYRGTPEENALLGVLVAGFAVDERLATVVSRITSSHAAFRYGKVVVVSSLSASQQRELSAQENLVAGGSAFETGEIRLGDETFVGASLELTPTGAQPVTLTVLKSYDAATLFLTNVNRLLLGVGLVAVLAGACLMFLISHTFTRPLARLLSGVLALEKGDFAYPLKPRSGDELGELTAAFEGMRKTLKESQQHLLHAERLATIGQMASTISHDLRHPLTTILAYAELLTESNLDEEQREDLYREIRTSVNNMAELITSLLEFSKAQEALKLVYGDVAETLQHTIDAVRMRPEFGRIQLTFQYDGPTTGWFDFTKLDRVFHNLLRNACEAAPPNFGKIGVKALGVNNHIEISVTDNGSGIPEEIRDDVFQPFVTFGKAEGTGLGLAVVQKIVRDHDGEVTVESSGRDGTTFKLTLPVVPARPSDS